MLYLIEEENDEERAFWIFTLSFSGDSVFSDALVQILRILIVEYLLSLKSTNPAEYEELQNFG